MPKNYKPKRFHLWVSTHRTDYLVTNEVEPHETAVAEQERSCRCTIEQFYHERKQLIGVPACQCQLVETSATTSRWTCVPRPD